jgi:hypothetical protein
MPVNAQPRPTTGVQSTTISVILEQPGLKCTQQLGFAALTSDRLLAVSMAQTNGAEIV